MEISFSMAGEPRGKGRPRVDTRAGFPRVHTDDKTIKYERSVSAVTRAAMAGRPPLIGPIALALRFRMPIPASATKRAKAAMASGETPHISKCDLDNMVKAVLDGMAAEVIPANKRKGTPKRREPIAFVDDCQIVRLVATKVYSEKPGVDVLIEAFAPQGGGE